MCGRFTLRTSAFVLAQAFGVRAGADWAPRYNIAPTQTILAVALNGEKERDWGLFRWGLIPSWADDPKIGNQMINARAETVAAKPAFRSAFRRRRCLILADGFYEWKKKGAEKQPLLICQRDGRPFAFAGLWERWTKGAQAIDSCTIITTAANARMQPVHDRMPVILPPTEYERWLTADPEEAEQLLSLSGAEDLVFTPVGRTVNNPRNDSPDCLTPETDTAAGQA